MRALLVAFGMAVVFFLLYPEADLAISRWFYRPEEGFYLAWHPLVRGIYKTVSYVTEALVLTLLAGMALKLFQRVLPSLRALPSWRVLLYLAGVLALGPWLAVHEGFKDGFGRPRPSHTLEFGGEEAYAPPFHIAPGDGKSFVSGHAAMGFAFAAPALLMKRRRRAAVYALGIALGLLVGLVRIMQGGHYASDVVFAGFTVLLIAHVLYAALFRTRQTAAEDTAQ